MFQSTRPRRSALYTPGSNLRALEKAKTLPADVLIMDLEDAVAPEAKRDARIQVVAERSGRTVPGFYQWLHRMRRALLDCIRSTLTGEASS